MTTFQKTLAVYMTGNEEEAYKIFQNDETVDGEYTFEEFKGFFEEISARHVQTEEAVQTHDETMKANWN